MGGGTALGRCRARRAQGGAGAQAAYWARAACTDPDHRANRPKGADASFLDVAIHRTASASAPPRSCAPPPVRPARAHPAPGRTARVRGPAGHPLAPGHRGAGASRLRGRGGARAARLRFRRARRSAGAGPGPVVGSPAASPYDSLPAPATIAAALELMPACAEGADAGRFVFAVDFRSGSVATAGAPAPADLREWLSRAVRPVEGLGRRLGQRTGARPGGAVSGQDDPLQRIRGPRCPARRLRRGGLPLGARGGALPGAPAPAAAPVVGHRGHAERRAGCARGADAGR